MATEYQRRPITAVEFNQMAELGIIGPEERLELLEGEIIVKPPINLPHISSVARLTRLFVMRFGERAVVAPQVSVRLQKHRSRCRISPSCIRAVRRRRTARSAARNNNRRTTVTDLTAKATEA